MLSTQPKAKQQQSIFKKQASSNKGMNGSMNQKTNTNGPVVDTSYLYTPAQYLISNFLTTKKTIEDDLINTLKGITEIRTHHQPSATTLRQQLHLKKQQLQGIKRKLNQSFQQQTQVYDIMRKRIHRHQPDPYANHSRLPTNNESPIDKFRQQSNPFKKLTDKNPDPAVDQITNNQVDSKGNIDASSDHAQKLFELNMNKQIAFFMVEESVRLEQKLKDQKERRRQKEEEDKKIRKEYQDIGQHFIINSNNNKSQRENNNGNTINNEQQQQILVSDQLYLPLIQQQQAPNPLLQQNIAMIQPDSIELYNQDDFLEIQRYLYNANSESEHIDPLRPHDNKDNKQGEKIEEEKGMKEELWFGEEELFKEGVFVEKLEGMDVQQNCCTGIEEKEKIGEEGQSNHHHNSHSHSHSKAPSSNKEPLLENSIFKDQIQLECMLYRKKHKISTDILSNSLQSITQFLYQNSHMIKKYESDLQFWVVLCRAIELIKSKNEEDQMKAIELMRSKIFRMKGEVKGWHKEELQKVTSMLLLNNFSISPKPYLQQTQQSFTLVFQQIYRLPDFSRFLHSLYTGALILKTPTCIQKDKQNPLICPLCNPLAEKVFKGISLLTRNQSNLICRLNGSVMDHENYPMMLPSNQIYSFRGLEETKNVQRGNSGKVVEQYFCKFTGTWYLKEQAKKVYLA